MKLYIIITAIVFSSLFAKAQRCGMSTTTFDLHYGYRSFTGSFYDQFNRVNKISFSTPLQVVGVGVSGRFIVNRGGGYNGHFTYNKIIPQNIRIQDSIGCKVSGFVYSMGYGTSIVSFPGIFNLDAYLGFNTGRIKCAGNELVRQKNPFFSPKIGLQPKFIINRIAISLRCEYESDVSRA